MRPLLPLLFLSASCIPDSPELADERWALIWHDEFRGEADSPPDADRWDFDIGTGESGWGNNELQYYTDRPENIRQNGEGFLIITGRREAYEGQEWTSARIKTQDLFAFAYGKVEARIKLPRGSGLWPAFWMLGSDIEDVSWPACGEIDIMENFAASDVEVSGTIHGPGYSGGASFGGAYTFPEGEDITGFHTYRVEWDPEHIAWYVDDALYHTATPGDVVGPWVLDHPFFLILNLAIGGIPVQGPDDTTPDASELVIDWVRVYQRTQPLPDPDLQ